MFALRLCRNVTGFGSPGSGARRFLVSSEKEFKEEHGGDISRSRIINAKQSESRAKSVLSR
jgi:hypothetical protein